MDPQQDMQTNLTIFKFEVRFFPVEDGQVARGRFEFVAYRTDGRRFRIHPGTSGATEKMPVPWAGQDTLRSAPRATPLSRGCSAPSQKNGPHCLTDAVGHDFLQSRVRAWEGSIAAGDQSPRFTANLTLGNAFPWKDFLRRKVDSERLMKKVVVECWLVWVGWGWNCAGFYLRFKDKTETVYTEMLSGRWETKDRMVKDIYWAA